MILVSILWYFLYKSAMESNTNDIIQYGNNNNNDIPSTASSKTTIKKSIASLQEEEKSRATIKNNMLLFKEMQNEILSEFYKRYGGKESAMNICKNGLTTFDDNKSKRSIEYTATRILSSVQTLKNSFNLSFGGYSVTVGRGNHFHQSYPFVLEGLLSPIFEKVLDIDFDAYNGKDSSTISD